MSVQLINRFVIAVAVVVVVVSAFTSPVFADQSHSVDGKPPSMVAKPPRPTIIRTLPYEISTPGSYMLGANLEALESEEGGIDINVGGVTLDLAGFTLIGNNIMDYGIEILTSDRDPITIQNGHIIGFGLAGVGASSASGVKLLGITANANGVLGTDENHSGIYLPGSGSLVSDSVAVNNGGAGIYVGAGAQVENNRVEGNLGVAGIYADIESTVLNNVAKSHPNWGIYVEERSSIKGNHVIDNNTAGTNTSGGGLIAHSFSVIENNQATNNTLVGITGNAFIEQSLFKNNQVMGVNSVGDAEICFYFGVMGNNAAIENTAAGCETPYFGDIDISVGNLFF